MSGYQARAVKVLKVLQRHCTRLFIVYAAKIRKQPRGDASREAYTLHDSTHACAAAAGRSRCFYCAASCRASSGGGSDGFPVGRIRVSEGVAPSSQALGG